MTPFLSALVGDAEIEGLLSDTAQVAGLLAVERALAEASAEVGWIREESARTISRAIDTFRPDMKALAAGLGRDGVVIPALVAQLREALPADCRSDLHRGATSQDIVDTAFALRVAMILDVVDTRIASLIASLSHLKASAGERTLMAHTRMQAALPMLWRDKVQTWLDPLLHNRTALAALRSSLVVQLGGPVGDRHSFNGHGDALAIALARRLNLGFAPPWHTARELPVALGGRLALMTGAIGKIGADVALLTQTEIGALILASGGASSAMAHKSNPVDAEALIALARYNAGLEGILQQAMVHEYERSGAAWTLEWMTLPLMMVTAGASLRIASLLVGRLRIREAR